MTQRSTPVTAEKERSDWEKHKNYPPVWSWATWPERAGIVAIWLVSSVVALAMAFSILLVIGESVDGISRYKSEHDRCLQKATNGYEIKECR